MQLHPTQFFLGARICLLCLDIINLMFFAQIKSIFMVFYLSILDDRFDLRKFFFSIFKNNFPMLIFTLKEKGGLNNIIFLFLILFSLFLVCSSLPWRKLFHFYVFDMVGMYYSLNSNVHQENLLSLNLYMHKNRAIFSKIMVTFIYFQKVQGKRATLPFSSCAPQLIFVLKRD